jgi:exonuclease SbcC
MQQQAFTLREISAFIGQRLEKENALGMNKKELNEKNTIFLALPEQVQASIDALHQAKGKLQSLQNEHEKATLRAKYEEDRRRLVQGEACFLCGSTEHPYVEHYQPEEPDEMRQHIREMENEVSVLTSEYAKLSNEQQNLKKSLQDLWKEIGNLEDSILSISEKETAHRLQINEPYRQLAPKDGLAKVEAQIKRLEEYIQLSSETDQYRSLYEYSLELLQLEKQLIGQKSKISSLYQGKDFRVDYQSLAQQFQDQERHASQLAEQHRVLSEQLKREQHQINQLEEQILLLLKPLGYNEISEALAHLMPAQEYEILQLEIKECQSALREVNVQVKDVHKRLDDLQENAPGQSDEELIDLQQQKQQARTELSSRRDELLTSLRYHRNNLDELQKAEAEYEKKKEHGQKWRMLGDYIGDGQGKKFSNFAQQLTLQQLVALANHRLKGLSDRYELDLPQLDDNNPEDDTLIIVDHDLGDIRRSDRTLSGGETFLVSLALALGLSDLASRNVDIQSLFIDEGFGTLDPETLDQTLDTLEKLQAESEKVIGVISHVGALKERITTRIEVHKNGQGYSTLKLMSREN